MSSHYPVQDKVVYTTQAGPNTMVVYDDADQQMQNGQQVNYQGVEEQYEEDYDAPVHAEGLESATLGEQTIRITARICASPAELESHPELRVYGLSTQQVKSMKLPNVMTDKNGVALKDRFGDASKTVFKGVKVIGYRNTYNFPMGADVEGLKKNQMTENGMTNVRMKGKTTSHSLLDISEPNSVVTAKMLQLHNPLQKVKMQIQKSSDPEDEEWGLKVREKNGDLTFTACLLGDMCADGTFAKINIGPVLADPQTTKVDVPKEILQRLLAETQEANNKIKESLIDMFNWRVTFKRADATSFVDDNKPVNGQYIGDDVSIKSNVGNAEAGVRGVCELDLEICYGMLE